MVKRSVPVTIASVLLLVALFSVTGLSMSYTASASSPSSGNSSDHCFVDLPSGSFVLSESGTETVAILPSGSENVYSVAAGNCSTVTGQGATINGYIESAQASANLFYSLSDQWGVPSAPSSSSGPPYGPVVFLFDGIQDAGHIFQPVLGYGCQAWYYIWCLQGGGFWWMSAEECNNSCSYSSAVQVSYSDTIVGKIVFTGQSGRTCAHYTITETDTTTGASTSLGACTSGGTEILPAAYEAHSVTSCNQLPNQPGMVFYNIASNPLTSSWNDYLTGGLSPSCNFGTPLNYVSAIVVALNY